MRKLIMMAAMTVAVSTPSCSVFAGQAQAERHEMCQMAGMWVIGTSLLKGQERTEIGRTKIEDLEEAGFDKEQSKWLFKAIVKGLFTNDPVATAKSLYESCMLTEA